MVAAVRDIEQETPFGTITADRTQEYLVGGGFGEAVMRILNGGLDELQAQVGSNVYRRMRRDPEVIKNVELIKMAVLADGVEIGPAVQESDPEFALAKEINDHCYRSVQGLTEKPIRQVLYEMMEMIEWGNKVAEIVFDEDIPTTGPDELKLMLKRIKPKPRTAVGFVVDAYRNLLGFFGRRARATDPAERTSPSVIEGATDPATLTAGLDLREQGQTLTGSIAGAMNGQNVILPKEKFLHLVNRSQDNDPRGMSSLECVYNAYHLKKLTWPQLFRYILQVAGPSIFGTCAEDQIGEEDEIDYSSGAGKVARNEDGTKRKVSAVQAFQNALSQFRNYSAMAGPFGSTVKWLEVSGDGSIFRDTIEMLDRQIATGITFNPLATKEGLHMARAAASSAMNVVDLIVWWYKNLMVDCLTTQLFRLIVKVNFGEDKLHLVPKVTMGDTERRDWAKEAAAASQLLNALQAVGGLTPQVIGEILTQLGFTPPSEAELKAQEKKNRLTLVPPMPKDLRGVASDNIAANTGQQDKQPAKAA